MKLNKIAALCKQKKRASIFECAEGRHKQWIGDGVAMFPVEGLPHLDKTALLTIFDVPEKDREKWYFTETEMPMQYDVSDYQDGEAEAITPEMGIAHAGMILKPIYTKRGVISIDSSYLMPLADVLDVLSLSVRWTKNGQAYIVARAGFLIQAIIMPWGGVQPIFAALVRELATACERAVEEKKAQERKDNPAQFAMDMDEDPAYAAPPESIEEEKPLRAVKRGKGK